MYARIFLAFLASAGLFYVNIMPAIVDGLKEGLAFTDRQAGFVASANVYGWSCSSSGACRGAPPRTRCSRR